MRILSAIFLLFMLISVYGAKIKLPTGVLQGVSGLGYDAYLGIPYALPPVGVLRWAPPMPNPKWNIGNATNFGAACPQSGSFYYPYTPQDENCLFLNIWVPDPLPTLGPVPVVIFIHGGAWDQGSGAQPLYWGDFIANTTGQILVTFNYRLGALGFISAPLLPGNYGIMDQQLAIKWVKSNILAFGGDPGNITLSGQSAGGAAVAIHMVTLQGQNLFQRARMESNPASLIYRTSIQSAPYLDALAGFMNCPSDSLACLRAESWQSVLAAQNRVAIPSFPSDGREVLPWMPAVDGSLLIDQPINYFARGNFTYIPTIINTVANETVSFIYMAFTSPLSQLAYEVLLGGMFPANFSEIIGLYYPEASDARPALARLTADSYMICPARAIARHMATYGAPVALTAFMYVPPIDPINEFPECENQASCHGAELAYTFHSKPFYNLTWTSPAEQQMSWRMLNYWTAESDNGVALPAYTPDTDMVFAFNLTDGVMFNYHSQACDVWDQILHL